MYDFKTPDRHIVNEAGSLMYNRYMINLTASGRPMATAPFQTDSDKEAIEHEARRRNSTESWEAVRGWLAHIGYEHPTPETVIEVLEIYKKALEEKSECQLRIDAMMRMHSDGVTEGLSFEGRVFDELMRLYVERNQLRKKENQS